MITYPVHFIKAEFRIPRNRAIPLFLLLFLPMASASAHDYWLMARPAEVGTGETVTLEICGGHHFPKSDFAIGERMVAALEIVGPDGVVTVKPVVDGPRWVAEWSPSTPGVYRAGFMLKRPRDDKPFASARALVVVGGADDPSAYAGGEGLEIVPRASLSSLSKATELSVEVHRDGIPVAAEIGFARENGRAVYRDARPTRPAVFALSGSGYYLLLARYGGHVVSMTVYVPEDAAGE